LLLKLFPMKTSLFRAQLAVLPLALATAFPSLAQSQAAASLKNVVVTASRVATPVTDVIADVSIIDRVRLEQAGQNSLRDVLAQLPGVQLVSNGSYRSGTGVFLRGASNNQSIVLIDGVRVGSATSGGASLENIPLDRIERIEVLRGAASALYGPDAVGGVIQIFTREPSESLQLAANVGAGSDGQRQAGASIRGSAGVIGYSLGVSGETADGISVSNAPAASGFNADADSFSSTGFDAKLTAKLSREQALTLSVLQSKTQYQIDSVPSASTPNPLSLNKLTTDTWSKPELTHINLKWDAQWTPLWRSVVTMGTSEENSVIEYRRSSDGLLNSLSRFNTKRTQATWQNDISVDKDVLSLMLEKRTEAVDSTTLYAVSERTIQSTLASYAFNRESWNALAVLRNDDNSQFGSFNNWALSGGYKVTPNLRAVASMGTSFQAPTLNQLYFPLTDGFKGDPTLTPQINRASELGLKYLQGNWAMGAVVYYNEIQGFISPSTNAQSSLAVLRGITLSTDLQQGPNSYSLSYDYADPRSFSSTAASNDLRLTRVAQNILNARVTHRLGDVNLFGELRLSSDREDGKVGSTKIRETLPGYALLNMGVNWTLRKDLSLLGRINNLTDTQYMLANGYSVPGRNVFVSLSWSM
jgi:vitamin B12 transporter